MNKYSPLVKIQSCAIYKKDVLLVEPFSWEMQGNETWLVTGMNGGGKELFLEALNQKTKSTDFVPVGTGALYSNTFGNDVSFVSLESAAALIMQERENDDGDYIEGGIDIGRTARKYLSECFAGKPEVNLESLPEVSLCGIKPVLDRGLKYLSTGEIRRVLLCRSLLECAGLLVLSDPFAGLDIESKEILKSFFSEMLSGKENVPAMMLCMERFSELPDGITNVLEFTDGKVSFCGTLSDYDKILDEKKTKMRGNLKDEKLSLARTFQELHQERNLFLASPASQEQCAEEPVCTASRGQELVAMRNVTVKWDKHVVLDQLDWTLYAGEHWLIRGPNGSGKTTFLELITGDNMQVFCNDVSIFGRRRGSGETVWELKERMGIVSYRMHIEYRMVGGTDLEAVLLSGLHDSIGLYQQRSQVEQMTARKWLALGGFAGREHEAFSSLSYGEQRAVLILRAAVKCPELLILDEPCHGLDETHRTRVLNLLESIAESGVSTLLHVTHDPTEALPCEKHILELCPGQKPMYRIIVDK